MKNAIAIFCAACLARAALAVTMASQPWTTNRIAEAEARLSAQITAATNAIPRAELPEYWPLYAVTNADGTAVTTQNFAGLNLDGIGATASDAWQMATDALSGLANVSTAFLPKTYSESGESASVAFGYGPGGLAFVPSELYSQTAYLHHGYVVTDDEQGPLGAIGQYGGSFITARQEVENKIREKSLGGIWDAELEVWWTPIMQNGALRYETSAVQNAADALAAVSNVVASGGLASVDAVDAKISTNNAAFVAAVLAVPIAGADAGDLEEIAEYGGYGTVGAAILALIAGLAALKRGKADKAELPYDVVQATPSNGVVTVGPRTIATYTAQSSAAAFTVAVGVGETGKGRDCELVIDCTATGAVAPTVTWPSNFHPRTDAATDFACEAGVRNVYFISEFSTGEFAVGGWQETTGGNGT